MKIEFKDCNIPLTMDNLIKISEEIGGRFYAKTIETKSYKNSWSKKYDSVTNRIEPIEVCKISNGYAVIRSHSFEYTNKEVIETNGFVQKTIITGLCPIEFDVNEDWNVKF